MKTFFGEYNNKNYVYSDDSAVLKSQLISILNTPIGTRFYYPEYGSNLYKYKFGVINYFTVNMIGQEIKNAISMMTGVSLSSITYNINGTTLLFNISLKKTSNIFRLNIKVEDGVAS